MKFRILEIAKPDEERIIRYTKKNSSVGYLDSMAHFLTTWVGSNFQHGAQAIMVSKGSSLPSLSIC